MPSHSEYGRAAEEREKKLFEFKIIILLVLNTVFFLFTFVLLFTLLSQTETEISRKF